ncbi:helix-turn-helix domain-containing protein [Petrimonas sp.]|uniref:helix-turn-helix domain-containing protein n=1 Tax=Petrimonas sp. TaxID=2023866 RepID=UPI003F5121CA
MKEKRKITEMEYIFASKRIDILLPLVTDKTPNDDPNYIELAIMTDVVWEYEEEHYPMDIPTPAALIEQAIIEKNMTQTQLASMIGVSKSRISNFVSGQSIPSLKLAGRICEVLGISPALMLGVNNQEAYA